MNAVNTRACDRAVLGAGLRLTAPISSRRTMSTETFSPREDLHQPFVRTASLTVHSKCPSERKQGPRITPGLLSSRLASYRRSRSESSAAERRPGSWERCRHWTRVGREKAQGQRVCKESRLVPSPYPILLPTGRIPGRRWHYLWLRK